MLIQEKEDKELLDDIIFKITRKSCIYKKFSRKCLDIAGSRYGVGYVNYMADCIEKTGSVY